LFKDPFIATQLNSTQRRVDLCQCRYKRAFTYECCWAQPWRSLECNRAGSLCVDVGIETEQNIATKSGSWITKSRLTSSSYSSSVKSFTTTGCFAHARADYAVARCPPVPPSHVGVVSKRPNTLSNFFHYR